MMEWRTVDTAPLLQGDTLIVGFLWDERVRIAFLTVLIKSSLNLEFKAFKHQTIIIVQLYLYLNFLL